MYRKLDPQKTIATLKTLANRINERFPGASLNGVCRELSAIAEETCGRIASVSRAYKGIRLAVILVIAAAGCLAWFWIQPIISKKEVFSSVSSNTRL